jgi:hypothetical protein
VLVGWGRFTPMVLAAEGAPTGPWVDIRGEVARRLRRRAHGLEDAARALAGPAREAATPGRAGHRLAGLETVLDGLRACDTSSRK